MIRAIPQPIVSPLVTSLVASPSGISGFAFPGETLTMPTGTSYQWFVNSDNRGTAQTLLLTVDDIGKTVTGIRNGVVLPTKTVWHPNTIPGVARFWMAHEAAYTSISPNVLATDGQGVRRWEGIASGTQADQTTGGLQPVYRAAGVGGMPSLQFDGTDDFLDLPSPSDMTQNRAQVYFIVGVKDTNPTGGSATHPVFYHSTGGGLTRLQITTRGGGGNNFVAGGRRLDADSFVSATAANDGNYHVLTAHGDFSNGFVRLYVDDTLAASTAFSSGAGNTSDTASTAANIGTSSALYYSGHVTGICAVNDALSATDFSRLKRYIALLGGTEAPTIALV